MRCFHHRVWNNGAWAIQKTREYILDRVFMELQFGGHFSETVDAHTALERSVI